MSMEKLSWKRKAFKVLSFGKGPSTSGRNSSGNITIFHRGGGAKRLLRRIDFERKKAAQGVVERIEYDPNRTAQIALVRWSNIQCNALLRTQHASMSQSDPSIRKQAQVFTLPNRIQTAFSYILACNELKAGDDIFNMNSLPTNKNNLPESSTLEQFNEKKGISLPLWQVPLGSPIYNVELYPGEGGKLVRAAGAYAQLIQKPLNPAFSNKEYAKGFVEKVYPNPKSLQLNSSVKSIPKACLVALNGTKTDLQSSPPKTERSIRDHQNQNGDLSPSHRKAKDSYTCIIRLPSGQQQLLDLRCRVTLGIVSNIDHNKRFLKKAGQKRWLGFRPVVRGVAMNPIDHPHGGGEGRTKGGRPSVSPWGKPAKGHKSIPMNTRNSVKKSR